ncbi:MAG: hypothetical protein F6K24_10215 [Okeania sp. SIO2D1]|nr:hypothetical protein [Okeania sp. SIO2D1]
MKYRRSLMNTLVLASLLLGLSWSFAPSSRADDVVDPAQAIANLEELVKPSLQSATDWGLKVGLGIVSAQAFYALVVRLIRLGD